MDFNRHPGVFRREEAYQNRYLMTDLVRRVRSRLDQVGAERGRHLKLAVRVAPTLANSARMGLDVSKWMADGLVDTVVAGVGWIPFEMPISEFVEEARGTGVRGIWMLGGIAPARGRKRPARGSLPLLGGWARTVSTSTTTSPYLRRGYAGRSLNSQTPPS